MTKIISLEQLLQKPVCYMSGEELAYLINNIGVLTGKSSSKDRDNSTERKLAYGIKGIADTFRCSIPTANRIKKSGVINKAISQVGRKIVLDVELALELAGNINKEG
jgi:hypothetical protein